MRVLKILAVTVSVLAAALPASAVTLQELIGAAKGVYNPLKEQEMRTDAQRLRYNASFDPFYPSLDYSLGYSKYYWSQINPSLENTYSYGAALTLSYKVFDLKRYAVKNVQKYSFLNEQLTYTSVEKDLVKYIKDLYAKIITQNQVLNSRREALKSATRTHELSSARREVGLAKLSDVYQAKVRLENARIAVVNAENDLNKLVFEIASVTIRNLTPADFGGSLELQVLPLQEQELFRVALENREEIRKEENLVKKAGEDRKSALADFLPTASVSATNRRGESSFYPNREENRLDATLSWNLFSGPGKFFRYSAAGRDREAETYRLNELKRTIMLDVKKAREDMLSNTEKVKAAEELVRSAQQTYDQTYEEYRVGKGEIINLLQAELGLAGAREEKLNALLVLNLSRSSLERSLGINFIEDIK